MAELAKHYSIGSGIMEEHEARILADLSAMYPDEGQRLIVENVLLPHFRAELNRAFRQFGEKEAMGSDRPVAPSRLPDICGIVDEMIEKNRTLLDLDGIFKPLMERVQEVRSVIAEALKAQFYQHCREILAGHGVKDRQNLLKKGTRWFMRTEFTPYGRGCTFAGKVLGRVMVTQIHIADLNEVSCVLGFEKLSREEELQQYRKALEGHEITDRKSLLGKGPTWFVNTNFPPYGRGKAFAGKILKKSLRHIEVADIEQIADVLGFEKPSREEELQKYREVLGEHGITDRQSLLRKGAKWFEGTEFPPYGKGLAFAGRILGRTVQFICITVLEEIADVLGFEKPSREDELKGYRDVLAIHGVTDKRSLLSKGPIWFAREEFSPYGKGFAFARRILGKVLNPPIRVADLEEISAVLGLPILSDESKGLFRGVLSKHGIIDRQGLLNKRPLWFMKTDFSPYGKGLAFAGKILGRVMEAVCIADLNEIADILWPSASSKS